jgi:hypothetical protein
MRNNLERLGLEEPQPTEEPPEVIKAANEGDDFSFIVAKHLIDLPSGGIFYPEGHPLRENPVVEIKEMTAREEDILANQSFAKDGSLIDRLLSSLVVSPKFNINDLLPGDKATLLLWSRIHSLGDDYEATMTCPNCAESKSLSFSLTECISSIKTNTPEECERTEENTFKFKLPKTKAEVEFRLFTGGMEKDLEKKLKKYDKHGIDYVRSAEELALLIVSIGGRRGNIAKIVEQIPASDIRALKRVIRHATPTSELTTDFECDKCGHEQPLLIPIGSKFFFPDA